MDDTEAAREAQLKLQESIETLLIRLIIEDEPDDVWETGLALIRFETDTAWDHVSAFLVAFTAARFFPDGWTAPSRGGFYDAFIAEFVAAVHREDADAAIATWTSPPVQNPNASAATEQSAIASEVLAHLRDSRARKDRVLAPRPAPFPRAVWIELPARIPVPDPDGL